MEREKEAIQPEYLYHYTTVEALAMILSSKTFRLTPLLNLDDMQEAITSDISEIGKTVFVSSWTSDENESIPMWNMYSKMESGVRIKALANPFEDWAITEDKTIKISNYLHYTKNQILFPPELKKVIYSSLNSDLFPQIVDSTGQTWNQEKLGIYKNTAWEFQQEWRYIVRIWPGEKYDTPNEDAETIYKKFAASIAPFLYLNIKPNVFDSLEVTLSPKISEGNRIIVQLLKEKYCPHMLIRNSTLYNCIR